MAAQRPRRQQSGAGGGEGPCSATALRSAALPCFSLQPLGQAAIYEWLPQRQGRKLLRLLLRRLQPAVNLTCRRTGVQLRKNKMKCSSDDMQRWAAAYRGLGGTAGKRRGGWLGAAHECGGQVRPSATTPAASPAAGRRGKIRVSAARKRFARKGLGPLRRGKGGAGFEDPARRTGGER